jgi:hypothetical protein
MEGTILKKPLLKAISLAAIIFTTPATPQTPDLPGTVKSIITGVNTVSEIYEKQTLTNGDVITISAIACSDIQLVNSNGTVTLASNIISNYKNKDDSKK